VSLLHRYLQRDHDRGLLDEWCLYLNTDVRGQEQDIAYAFELEVEHDWITILERPAGCVRIEPKQRNTAFAYRHFTDPDSVYVRFDDDIIYVHGQAIENIVAAKQAMAYTLGCFPMIINNAVCSWYLQQLGKIPREFGVVQAPFCMDPIGWADGQFAEQLHNLFLDSVEAGTVEQGWFTHQDFPLAPRQQFSVSCFALSGSDLCQLDPPGVLDHPEEEHWLTVERPLKVGKDNMIIGNAFVAHYTFFPHRDYIHTQTDVLDRYRKLAEQL
jgi:hypothetical protein